IGHCGSTIAVLLTVEHPINIGRVIRFAHKINEESMKTTIQASVRMVISNLVPALVIIGIVNTIDIEAAMYYVSTSGNDANSCATAQGKSTSAKRHIASGIQCLSAGDTLRIQAGTYTDQTLDLIRSGVGLIPSGTAGAPTIIEANPGDEGSVIIKPMGGD